MVPSEGGPAGGQGVGYMTACDLGKQWESSTYYPQIIDSAAESFPATSAFILNALDVAVGMRFHMM
jgi:hypothetical protein